MPINFYDVTVVPHLRGLQVLAHLLEKAKAHSVEKKIPLEEIFEWRLVEDMHPFRFQVQTVCNAAKNAMVVCAHLEMPSVEDNEKTIADLEARVASTQALLKSIDPASVNGNEDKPAATPERVRAYVPEGITGLQFFLTYSNANFQFHLATAYGILRAKGVDIGKKDWLGAGLAKQ